MVLEPIDYTEKLVQPNFHAYGTHICFDCENCYGGCPWTAVDEETGQVKFEPVPGWTVKKARVKTGRDWRVVEQIVDCPMCDPSPERNRLGANCE